MYLFIEAFRAALTNILGHRMRSFLTTLGILIGTASVIAVVSLVQGFSASIKDQFADLGSGTMSLRAENGMENARTGKFNNITFADVDVLRYGVKGIGQVAPMMNVQSSTGASYKGRTAAPQVLATTTEYQLVRSSFPEFGRFIVASDDKAHRRVAVIGAQLRDDLKMPMNPVGRVFPGQRPMVQGGRLDGKTGTDSGIQPRQFRHHAVRCRPGDHGQRA